MTTWRGQLNNQRELQDERLLWALVEHLKTPLTHIARHAELAKDLKDPQEALELIEFSADTTMQLIDSYLLGQQLAHLHEELFLEPVSLSAVLHDVSHKLSIVGKKYNCSVQLDIMGRYEPVMANRQALEAALVSLGHVFIEAQAAQATAVVFPLTLAAHRSSHGIVAGMFGKYDGLSTAMFRRGRQLYGTSKQPLNQFSPSTGIGVFVADSLLTTMSARLRVAHHHKLSGLAATFSPSRQLQLV